MSGAFSWRLIEWATNEKQLQTWDQHGNISDEHPDGAEGFASRTGEPDIDLDVVIAKRLHVDLSWKIRAGKLLGIIIGVGVP